MPLTASTAPRGAAGARSAWMTSSTTGGERLAAAVEQLDARPADGAGVRLRVEAPVAGIVVLGLARRAHREAGHRRRRPVVGHAADDREARPAVRAVDERVAEAAIGRVAQLGEAVVAGRRVRRDQRVGVAAARALDDTNRARRRRPVLSRRARRARAAAPRGQPGEEALDAPPAPSTSSTTPRSSLSTKPPSCSSRARRYTNGRKPTPWTTPCTRARDARRALTPPPRSRRLHELAQHVLGGGLRLLDARDVLRRLTTTWSASPRRRPAAVVADQRDRHAARAGAPRASAATTLRESPLVESASSASPGRAVGDDLAREDRLGADVVGDRREDRRVGAEVERRPRRPAAAGGRREVGDDVHRVGRRAAVAEREQRPAASKRARSARGRARARRGSRAASARAARRPPPPSSAPSARTSASTASRSSSRSARNG